MINPRRLLDGAASYEQAPNETREDGPDTSFAPNLPAPPTELGRCSDPMARTHETTPLLAGPKARRCSHNVDHVDGVADGPVCDPLDSPFASPLDWSPRFKWGIVALLAYAAFTVYVVVLIPSWPLKQGPASPITDPSLRPPELLAASRWRRWRRAW